MPLYTRVTKTRIASHRGELTIKKGTARPLSGKIVECLTIAMNCDDGKKRSIILYGDELDALRKELDLTV